MQGSIETVSPSAILVLQNEGWPHEAVLTAIFLQPYNKGNMNSLLASQEEHHNLEISNFSITDCFLPSLPQPLCFLLHAFVEVVGALSFCLFDFCFFKVQTVMCHCSKI